MNTAELLKQLRESHGYSQQYVADKLKINRTTYVKYETGVSSPIRKISELASLYGVTIDYLLGRDIDITKLPGYLGPVTENKKVPIIGSVNVAPMDWHLNTWKVMYLLMIALPVRLLPFIARATA
jgi:transcriptional regulator with XRE-family HTH domain